MSVISDAIVASMASGLDPMNGVTRDFADKVIEEKDAQVIELKLTTMERIQSAMAKAKAGDAPVTVIEAYDRLLARITS